MKKAQNLTSTIKKFTLIVAQAAAELKIMRDKLKELKVQERLAKATAKKSPKKAKKRSAKTSKSASRSKAKKAAKRK